MTYSVTSDEDETGCIRLNRFLASCGLGSRRKCDDLIQGGHIFVNGSKVSSLGVKVHPDSDNVEYHGKKVVPIKKIEYIAFNKPRGVVVTKNDPENRTTVFDSLKCASGRDFSYLNYIGRLDLNSEGLLLLTNDGDLIHALTHPRYRIKKVYHVKIERKLEPNEIETMIDGIESDGQLLRAGSVTNISQYSDERKQFWYEVVLYEGKNRQIRRMFEALNILISKLRRVQFASVKIGELESGSYRFLTEREIGALKNAGYKV